MASPVLQLKRGAFTNLPGLRVGEPGFTTDKYDLYVGLTSSLATNQFFGSGRYWSRENGTKSLGFNLVDKNGTNYVQLKSPDTLSGITTYTLPETPVNGAVLTTNLDGDLSWTTSPNLGGEFTSSLVPNLDDEFDIGDGTASKRWRHASFSGVGTFSIGVVADGIRIGISSATEIDTASGDLIIDSATGTTTIDDELVVSGDVRINGNDIRSSDNNVNITLTSNTLTTFAGDIRVNGNDIQASDGNTNIIMTSNTLTATVGDLKVGGNDIQDSGGNNVFTFDGSQNVTANNDLTVSGNLYVNGSTTQVNTSSISVEDRTIELGLVDGNAPASATTWDLGVLFNYNSSGAKKAAVAWEHADGRFKFASQVSDGGGTGVANPQLTFTAYAPIEISALWVNDCAGQSQVINCANGERTLENITIDGGSF